SNDFRNSKLLLKKYSAATVRRPGRPFKGRGLVKSNGKQYPSGLFQSSFSVNALKHSSILYSSSMLLVHVPFNRSRRPWRLFKPSVSRRSSITTSAIGSSIGSYTVADLPVLELLDGTLPLEVFLVVDGFMKDYESLVLLLFVFLPWFGPTEGSSSSSSSSCYLLWFLT
ncbi:hypothetical protein Tco_1270843, partial [Tanacetum coccineum]